MSTTLKLPLNEEQQSVVKAPLPSKDSGPTSVPRPSPGAPTNPFLLGIVPPNLPRKTPPRPLPNHQWGIIPVRFIPSEDIPEKDEQQANDDSDFDFNTPYPSSELGTSSFIMTDSTFTSVTLNDDHVDNKAPASALGLEKLSSNRASPDSAQTPPSSISRGLRRI
ncbi:hypothetical protein JB92DRAFT_2827668 [Gautieria morchelliformis]|nr:hypothetical protein JB92DRAFT_2827668 [Gautieria morchelliformis]